MRIAAKGMPTRHYTNCIYPAGNKQLLKIPDFLKFIVHLVKTLLPTYDVFLLVWFVFQYTTPRGSLTKQISARAWRNFLFFVCHMMIARCEVWSCPVIPCLKSMEAVILPGTSTTEKHQSKCRADSSPTSQKRSSVLHIANFLTSAVFEMPMLLQDAFPWVGNNMKEN